MNPDPNFEIPERLLPHIPVDRRDDVIIVRKTRDLVYELSLSGGAYYRNTRGDNDMHTTAGRRTFYRTSVRYIPTDEVKPEHISFQVNDWHKEEHSDYTTFEMATIINVPIELAENEFFETVETPDSWQVASHIWGQEHGWYGDIAENSLVRNPRIHVDGTGSNDTSRQGFRASLNIRYTIQMIVPLDEEQRLLEEKPL